MMSTTKRTVKVEVVWLPLQANLQFFDGLVEKGGRRRGRKRGHLRRRLPIREFNILIISRHTGKHIKAKGDKKKEDSITWAEKDLFEKAMQKHYPRYYPFFLTALRTGMRLGELVALQPGDLDFNGGSIEVKRSYSKGRLTTPKSDKTRRVNMSNGLAETLKQLLIDRKKEALQKGWGEPPGLLFYNEAGNLIDIKGIRKRVFYKCLEKAGLRQIRIHDLRHSYGCLRISKGDNILDVSKH